MTQVIDFIGGEYRNRTGVHGFAIQCISLQNKGLKSKKYQDICRTINEPDTRVLAGSKL